MPAVFAGVPVVHYGVSGPEQRRQRNEAWPLSAQGDMPRRTSIVPAFRHPSSSCSIATTSDAYSGEQRPMIDEASRCLGSYGDAVVALRKHMWAARALSKLADSEKLEVVVFGHGGRDTNLWLAVVEAVSRDKGLRDVVRVQVCSCSWPNDEWEHVMASYADRLCINGPARKGSIKFHYMKFHEDHAKLRARIDEHLRGKHLVVQCEQGVDFFHEPVTGEWLQDNYEDNMVHMACTNYVERVAAGQLRGPTPTST